jgi:hypothetical protein
MPETVAFLAEGAGLALAVLLGRRCCGLTLAGWGLLAVWRLGVSWACSAPMGARAVNAPISRAKPVGIHLGLGLCWIGWEQVLNAFIAMSLNAASARPC